MTHPFQQFLSFSTALVPLHDKIQQHIPFDFPMTELVSANGLVTALTLWAQDGSFLTDILDANNGYLRESVPVWGIHEPDSTRIWIVWMDSRENFTLWRHDLNAEVEHLKLGKVAG